MRKEKSLLHQWLPSAGMFLFYVLCFTPVFWGLFAVAQLIRIPWYVTASALIVAALGNMHDTICHIAENGIDLILDEMRRRSHEV